MLFAIAFSSMAQKSVNLKAGTVTLGASQVGTMFGGVQINITHNYNPSRPVTTFIKTSSSIHTSCSNSWVVGKMISISESEVWDYAEGDFDLTIHCQVKDRLTRQILRVGKRTIHVNVESDCDYFGGRWVNRWVPEIPLELASAPFNPSDPSQL